MITAAAAITHPPALDAHSRYFACHVHVTQLLVSPGQDDRVLRALVRKQRMSSHSFRFGINLSPIAEIQGDMGAAT
jgi:hypothetical protein